MGAGSDRGSLVGGGFVETGSEAVQAVRIESTRVGGIETKHLASASTHRWLSKKREERKKETMEEDGGNQSFSWTFGCFTQFGC